MKLIKEMKYFYEKEAKSILPDTVPDHQAIYTTQIKCQKLYLGMETNSKYNGKSIVNQ